LNLTPNLITDALELLRWLSLTLEYTHNMRFEQLDFNLQSQEYLEKEGETPAKKETPNFDQSFFNQNQ